MADALKEAVAFMERAGAMLGRGEMPSPTSLYAVKWHAAHATILAALSAAEARERVLRETLAEIAEASWPDHETGTGVERIQRFAARALLSPQAAPVERKPLISPPTTFAEQAAFELSHRGIAPAPSQEGE